MTQEQLAEYAAAYPDVQLSGLSPKEHWELVGSVLGRTLPSPGVSPAPAPHVVAKPSCRPLACANGSSRERVSTDRSPRLAAFVHLYYRDLWDEVAAHLSRIPLQFDLYVTLSDAQGPAEKWPERIREIFPGAEVLMMPNRGLDCAPFVEIFRHALKLGRSYDYALKLHTKKSLGADPVVGEWWRKKTYDSLLGSPQIVLGILRRFASNPDIGMIGPANTRMSITHNDELQGSEVNRKNFQSLAHSFGVKDDLFDFFGGTMFWFRWDSLVSYLGDPPVRIDDYEPGYQVDGLLAHGMERLLASMVRDSGHMLYEQDYINDVLARKHERKSICFVHPGFGIGGGNRTLFEICRELTAFYNVYSLSFMGGPFTNWMEVAHPVVHLESPDKLITFMQAIRCDYVFATGWQTFDFVNNLSSQHKKFYFIQDYEPWFAGGEGAAATYRNGFAANFVNGKWLQAKLLNDHNLPATFVRVGARPPANNIQRSPRRSARTVLCYYKLRGHLGRGADQIELFLQAFSSKESVEVLVVGHEAPPDLNGAIFLGELHGRELHEIYTRSDILVDLSRHRGHATMAMEAAFYGTVPILSAPEYSLEEYGFVDGHTALIANSPLQAVEQVKVLCSNADLFANLSERVRRLADTFSYSQTIKQLVPALEDLCD